MQTFLPYASFEKSMRCLDMQRLGKQRVEAIQILRTLTSLSNGWQNHPAVKMWRGHEWSLYAYACIACHEWQQRGYKNIKVTTMLHEILDVLVKREEPDNSGIPWLGDPAFHLSHRSNLMRKNPEHYQRWFGDTPSGLPYVWPV